MNPLTQLRKRPQYFWSRSYGLRFCRQRQHYYRHRPPDGGYPNNNTAEGDFALFNLTNGFDNTAIGWEALFLNTEGDFNTAIGAGALASNQGSFQPGYR